MDFQHIEATFGKLEHCSLSFSSGLNIIEAPNESGKSTLLAFLRVMLYGFPPRERGALADKNRYAPWSLSPMRGTLSLSSQKGNITLQRDTARANSPMGRFSAIYTGSGESVDGLTAADCGETLLGIPCEVYERSAFIRQSSLTVDASAELERRIAALITTGEEGQSFSEASAALKKQLNARKYNKSGRIPALEAAVAAQERSLAELSQLTRSRQEAEAALAAFDAEEASLRAQLRAHDICDAQGIRLAAAQARQRWQAAESSAEQLRRTLIENSIPPRDALEQGRMRLIALSSLKADAADARQRYRDAEGALAAFDAKPAERVHSLLPYIIVSAVLFAALMAIQTLPAAVAMAGRVLSGIALLALLIIDANSRRKVRRVHDEKRRVFEQALREAQSDAAAQQKLCDSAARELLVLIPAGDISRVSTYLDTALHKYAELDTLEREARELSLRCELLSAQQPQSDVPTEPAVRPTRSRTELQSALDALTVRRREAQSTFDYTSGRCRAIGDAAELEAALTQKRDELAQKQAEYDAIALAMESLQSANIALQNRFSPALSRRAGELFSRLTGGKYESVLLDRTFSAQAGETGESVSHDAQLLSLGTLDQLYLAVRLAICESVLPADDPPPIVLDDALVRFDDARCRAALDLLLEESKSRQILLFTCQHRESAYLAGRDGVTLLSL
ncbi:MAG: AAA family ATPase [Oscillibacter sp.]|nr:AAA family ATPase [Oscillibacter sp.]MDY4907565.1 AAA family ATPase [Oscillospiraceae bacterium]